MRPKYIKSIAVMSNGQHNAQSGREKQKRSAKHRQAIEKMAKSKARGQSSSKARTRG